jgi:hypothetical protein
MKITITILAIVAIVAGVGAATTSLIPIHQVNAQVVPDLGRGLPSAGFPPNPNADPVCAVLC